MPLTSDTPRKIAEKVVTDVNANVPLGSSAARHISREAAVLFDKSVVAKPLMAPEVCQLRVKHTEYAYRWVFRSQSNDYMYRMRLTQGFTNATLDDVEPLAVGVSADKSEIRCHDLILMKIPAELYDAALKWNMEKALTLQRMRGVYFEGASTDVNDDTQAKRVSVSNEPFDRKGLASTFIPRNPDAIVDDSVRSGRIEGARKSVEEIRERHESAPRKE